MREVPDVEEHANKHNEPPTQNSWQNTKLLFTFGHERHLFVLFLALASSILTGCVQPALSWLSGHYLDRFSSFAAGSIDSDTFLAATWQTVYSLLSVAGASLLINGALFSCWIVYGEARARSCRKYIYICLVRQDIQWFDGIEHGVDTAVARINVQIRDLQLGVSQPSGLVVAAISRTVASLALGLYANWKLSLAIVACAPVVVILLSISARGLQEALDNQQQEMMLAAKHTNHVISNIVVIKSYSGERHELESYTTVLKRIFNLYRKQAHIIAPQAGIMRSGADGIIILALMLSTIFIHRGGGEYGKVLTALWSTVAAMSGFDAVQTEWPVIARARSAAVSLKDRTPGVKASDGDSVEGGRLSLNALFGDIEFKHVSFAYPSRPGQDVLKDVSLYFP
ncbi:ATP-dependent permease, partial [Elasticomyces elasticus]